MAKDDPYFRLRIPANLLKQVQDSAAASNRSATAEILSRLADSFGPDPFEVARSRSAELTERIARLEQVIFDEQGKLQRGRSSERTKAFRDMLGVKEKKADE